MPDRDPEAAARTLDEDEPEADPQEPLLIEFDAFRADLTAYSAPPQADDPAPARLFARGLGAALWYNAAGLARGDERAEAEAMPIGMFEPAECADDRSAAARR